MTYTDLRSVVFVWMKDGLLWESLILPTIAKALSPAKSFLMMVGMKRYCISPALLVPVIAASVDEVAESSCTKSGLDHLSEEVPVTTSHRGSLSSAS